jgi:hypothetical protein
VHLITAHAIAMLRSSSCFTHEAANARVIPARRMARVVLRAYNVMPGSILP